MKSCCDSCRMCRRSGDRRDSYVFSLRLGMERHWQSSEVQPKGFCYVHARAMEALVTIHSFIFHESVRLSLNCPRKIRRNTAIVEKLSADFCRGMTPDEKNEHSMILQ